MFRTPRRLSAGALASFALLGIIVSPARAQNPYATYAPLYESPYGGYLRGGAEVIRAQGQFLVQKQQAYSMYTEDQRNRIKLRRERVEQWLWERENLPT